MTDHITVIGNIATVPERKVLPSGTVVLEFRLATSDRRHVDGRWTDVHTSYYGVSVYGSSAEHAFVSLAKGERVVVAGRLRVRRWESGGKRGAEAEIVADALGHDLRFGSTSFRPDERPGSRDSGSGDREEGLSAERESRGAPTPGGETAESELVGAAPDGGQWSPAPLGDPIPF